jgi:ketosteroid isomerase-like protein
MKRLILVSAIAVFAACASSTPMSSGDAESAIRRANSEFSANVRTANAQAIVDNYYAPDAVGMAPNMPALHGREALRQFWTGFLSTGAIDVVLTSDNVSQPSSDVAVEMGHYDLSITPSGAQAIKDKGKYLVMWKKENGRWWAVEDIFNSDLPQPR